MLESMINTKNDNIINIHPSIPRNDNLPINQNQNMPNVSQTLTTSKTTKYLKNNPSMQEDTNKDPYTQEPTNSITENEDEDISWENENNSEDDLLDIDMEVNQREEEKEEEEEEEEKKKEEEEKKKKKKKKKKNTNKLVLL